MGRLKVLYIGGTGVISSACVRKSLELGHEVHVFNRGKRPAEFPGEVRQIQGDRKDAAGFRKAFGKETYDVVADFLAYDAADTETLLSTFEGRCGQIVVISSTSACQKPPASIWVTESTPLRNPFWKYSQGKIEVERVCMSAYLERGTPVTIVRPAYTYGLSMIPGPTGSNWNVAHRILQGKPMICPPQVVWTLTYNEDFAVGFCGLMGHPAAIGQPFQIAGDEAHTWEVILRTVGEALGRKVEIVGVTAEFVARFDAELAATWLGDKANSVLFDSTKIRRLVPAFQPEIRLHEGVRRCLEWCEVHPEFKIVDGKREALLDEIAAGWRRALDAAKVGQ
ncbi:MAG: NAD-dependent epimerase/dehydratase family protein [Planctomycetota bacterium]|nr:NAD-dependent epimerase/dehydratase family protein [Planctomycetota bacterium]